MKDGEQEAAGVLQKRNELYERLAELQSQSAAKMRADIDEEQRRLDSKKRKLAKMM